MKPAHEGRSWAIYCGDVIEVLRQLSAESVQTVVTSPPYWGLRDYSRCECATRTNATIESLEPMGHGKPGGQITPGDPRCEREPDPSCPKCGGTGSDSDMKENQIGLESTPEEYVARLVEAFREVRRVLRDDGTVWLNLGDAYSSGSGGQRNISCDGRENDRQARKREKVVGAKPKDLLGLPWRLAFALQADGWWLRCDIVWSKPNPMPESIADRPTRAHEFIFLLAKSGETLYWLHPTRGGSRTKPEPDYIWEHLETKQRVATAPDGWEAEGSPWRRHNLWDGRCYFYDGDEIREPIKSTNTGECSVVERQGGTLFDSTGKPVGAIRKYQEIKGANRRSVWHIATEPFPEAHFATFPRALVEPCVKAGTSEHGACSVCGAPWARVVESNNPSKIFNVGDDLSGGAAKTGNPQTSAGLHRNAGGVYSTRREVGWSPTCAHSAPPRPCVVLDPFSGSATVGVVALSLGRHFVGVELKQEYCEMAARRIRGAEEVPLPERVHGQKTLGEW